MSSRAQAFRGHAVTTERDPIGDERWAIRVVSIRAGDVRGGDVVQPGTSGWVRVAAVEPVEERVRIHYRLVATHARPQESGCTAFDPLDLVPMQILGEPINERRVR